MKVLLTHELFMPDFAGGGEKVVYETAKWLMDNGIDVKVLTTGNPNIKKFKGIPTKRLPINRYFMNFTVPWIMREAEDCDLIQTFNYNACFPSWLAAKIIGKPVVCYATGTYADNWYKIRGPIGGFISKWVEKFQLDHSFNRIIFPSEFTRRTAIKMGIPKRLTAVANPGIEHEKFKPKKKEWYVLFMGRFAMQKGVYDLIEAAKRLPDVKFKLVGWGEEEKSMRKDATENVEFYNYTFRSGRKFFDMYSHAAIYCQPSVIESFGLTIVEAMASGCAIVATTDLGYRGIVIKPNKPKSIVAAIEKLLENKKKTLKMGRENIKLAKKYTWNNYIKKFISVYDELLKK
jgi:glycosyltransferase involved in cell wall biosynthesis